MPASIEQTQEGIFLLTCTGDLTSAEYARVVRELWAHPAFAPGARVLWDLREGTLRWSKEEVRAQARFLEAERPKVETLVAVVVDSDVSFGLTRMIGGHIDGIPVEISPFSDFDAALAWLRN